MDRKRFPVWCLGTLFVGLGCSDGGQPTGGAGAAGGSGATAGSAGQGGASNAGSGGTAGASVGGTAGTSAAGSGSGPTLPTLRPSTHRVPEPVVIRGPCSGNDAASATLGAVRLGQTHLSSLDSPFLTVSAERPLAVAVEVTGSGAPPAISVSGRVGSDTLETLCFVGPATLPGTVTNFAVDLYRATLPSSWVRPGLELTLRAGSQTRAVPVAVKARSSFTIYTVSGKLFDDGQPEALTDATRVAYAARLPVSELQIGHNPIGEWRPERLMISARTDGLTPNGDTAAHGPIVVAEYPHCSNTDRTNGTCTPHSGYGLMSGVRGGMGAIARANAVPGAVWYVELSRNVGGGLAGGDQGTGDDFGYTMNHELGHCYGWPHWGTGHLGEYPYAGQRSPGAGGFGRTWGIDQTLGLIVDPTCEGTERQSPMQRSGATCVPQGGFFDYHSDYEAARFLQYLLGGAERTGTVPYAGGSASFRIPSSSGRYQAVWNPAASGVTFRRYDAGSNALVDVTRADNDRWGWTTPETSEVPVRLFYGAALLDVAGQSSFFNAPVDYHGNTVLAFDMSTPEGFASVKSRQSSWFYWAQDVHLRFTTAGGQVFYRVAPTDGKMRDPGDALWFAINLPLDLARTVVKAEVLSRPLGHYTTSSSLTSSANSSLSHQNYYASARVLAAWQRP